MACNGLRHFARCRPSPCFDDGILMNFKLAPLVAALVLAAASSTTSAAETRTLPSMTRKVVLEKTDNGGHRWKLVEGPVPALGDRQVLVHVRAVSLNRGDHEMLDPSQESDYAGLVPTSDAAGEVLATGKLVKDFKPGMRVTTLYFRNWTDGLPNDKTMSAAHGASVDGVLAEYLVIDDTGVVAAPDGLSHEEAATLPTAGLTAWRALMTPRALQPTDVVLVQGTGGVSTFALQFAATAGAKVIVTSSSDEKLKRARSLGASEGINYRTTPDWSKRVLELTGGRGANVIVDVGGKETLPLSAKSLAYDGTLSIVGGLSGYNGQIWARNLLIKSARAQGIYVGSRAEYLRMSKFITQHKLRPVIEREFPLEQFDQALELMDSGNFVGKIVLKL
jgi:NADPH:quinone reductase-like Zn-dependent oxidoreductase